jgi:predicted 2-oxoglutarate/Fe(II)-dependent dioxygenase YbiX
MILEFPRYAAEVDVAFIREAVAQYGTNSDADTYSGNREGTSLMITGTPGLEEVDAKINSIMLGIQEEISGIYETSFGSGDNGYEYHKYGVGQVCKTHTDGIVDKNTLLSTGRSTIRYASVVLHLTTNNGGELVFPNQNKSIKTEAGKVVVFPPYGTHRHYTTPAVEDREVIVTWFTLVDLYAINLRK